MEFKNRLKQRFIVAVSYIVLGIALIGAALWSKSENYFLFSFGIALLTMGILRVLHHRKVTKDDDSIRRQERQECDERTRMIAERARSWSFSLSVTLAGIAVIVLSLMGKHSLAEPFSWFVCGMVVLYFICYSILNKKY